VWRIPECVTFEQQNFAAREYIAGKFNARLKAVSQKRKLWNEAKLERAPSLHFMV
jgi:hypothetical protein